MRTRVVSARNAQRWQDNPPTTLQRVYTATNGEEVWAGVWPDEDELVLDLFTVEEYEIARADLPDSATSAEILHAARARRTPTEETP